jgi:2-haloacid dehalogenase
VLVDLDGTVLDYETAERAALLRTLEELGVDADDGAVAAYRRINREHWERLEQGAISSTELRTARWVAFVADRGLAADGRAAARRYLELLAASEDLVPGARAALWWLGRRSRLVALTNGFDDVQRGRLAASGLTAAFDGYASSESAGAAKPDPAIVDAALATVGAATLDRREVVVVGDQLGADVAVGAAVGATTVWVTHDGATVPAGAPVPDHTVGSIAELA